MFNVLSLGADPTGVADSSGAFIGAIARANVINGSIFVPPGNYQIAANVTVPVGVEIWFANGVALTIAGAMTFDIQGTMMSPILPQAAGAGTLNHTQSIKIMGETVTALAFANPLNVNMAVGGIFTTTANGDSTINAAGGIANKRATFVLTGDAAGGRVMTFGAGFTAFDTLILSASAKSAISFIYDGAAWVEVSRSPQMPVYIWK